MVRTPKYELAEERLGRDLAEQLRLWQSHGISAPAIARFLAAETRVIVTAETVRTWLRLVDEENGEAA